MLLLQLLQAVEADSGRFGCRYLYLALPDAGMVWRERRLTKE